MKTYTEIANSIPTVSDPERLTFKTIYGYADGKVLGTFPSRDAATKAGANVIEVSFDKDGYRKAQNAYRKHLNTIEDLYRAELFLEYSNMGLSEQALNVIYTEVRYEYDLHPGNSDFVSRFESLVHFAVKIIGAN